VNSAPILLETLQPVNHSLTSARALSIMAPMDVLAQVRATIDGYDLLTRGSGVVVAVSGGPDSLCLLHVLVRLQGEYRLHLHVAHLNHMLRAEADADAAFVASLAEQWGLPSTVGSVDVRTLARAEHRSLEEAARVARYRFLAQVASAVGAPAVAVGHNADDQVETVLMHCLRGSGLAGLRGMRRRAHWPEAAIESYPPPTLIRPLLDVPRADVEAYLDEQGIQARLDITNVELTFFRNRIRHELVPILESYNPRFRRLLHHTADVLADDYAYLQQAFASLWPQLVQQETPESIVLRRPLFQELPHAAQRSALRQAIRTLRRSLRDIGWLPIETARHAAIRAPAGTTVTLPAGLVLDVSYDRLIVRLAGHPWVEPEAIALAGPERKLQLPGRTVLAPHGWALMAWLSDRRPSAAELAEEGRLGLCLDAQRAGVDLRLRTRRPGDLFQPHGLGGHHKSVKEYMIDAKIPRAQRDRVPLLVSERGILWVVGFRASEVALPSTDTRRFLCLQLIPPPDAASSPEATP